MESRRRQAGSQAVEFALVLPFMLLIIFAVLDFAFLTYNKAVITNASREAARRAIVLTTSAWNTAAIQQTACNYAQGALIRFGGSATNASCTGADDPRITVVPAAAPAFNDPVTVTVQFDSRGFSMGGWFNLGNSDPHVGSMMTISATTQMLKE